MLIKDFEDRTDKRQMQYISENMIELNSNGSDMDMFAMGGDEDLSTLQQTEWSGSMQHRKEEGHMITEQHKEDRTIMEQVQTLTSGN